MFAASAAHETPETGLPSVSFYHHASAAAGAMSAIVAAAVLAGWWLHIDAVKNVLPGLATMKFNTALGFFLTGIALCAPRAPHNGRRVALACALLVFTIAMVTLLEYRFGWNAGIDELAVRDPRSLALPGRMSVATALGFFVVALAIALIDVEWGTVWRLGQSFALLGILIGGAGLLGYVFGIRAMYRSAIYSSMGLHTAALFVIAGLGTLLARPDRGLMAVLTSAHIGGRLSRIVLPAVLLVPVALGWLSLVGLTAGLYGTGFGFALNSLASIVILATVVWVGARRLNLMQQRVESASRQHAFLATIIESSGDAVVSKDLGGIVTTWNPGAERIYGYAAAEMLGKPLALLLPPDRYEEEQQILARISRGERFALETMRRRKDGRLIDMSICVSPIRDEHGNIIAASDVGRDITERKRAEERFRLVVEAAPNAMVMVNREGRIVLVNSQTEKVFGYPREELIGQPIETLVPERFRSAHPGHRAGFFGDPVSRPMGTGRHLYGLRRNGTELPVEIGLNPIETSEGTFVLAAIVDITERKRLEERFRATVESAPTAMVMVDRKGRITLVNALTETLFGYRREQLLGQPVEILLPERYRATHPGLRDGFFHVPSARRMGEGRDLYALRADGSEFPVEIGLNPIETSEGVFVLGAIADITERKRAEHALRGRTDELARSNQDLEQFAYVASHDLQEPLRAVSGSLQLLQRRYQGQLDTRADEFIGHAVDGAARMQGLIDDLLTYSRVGRQGDPRQLTECGQALDQALKNLNTAIREAGAQVSRDTLPTVRAIPAQLSVLFQNLIGNAIKFRRDDVPVQIHVGAERRGDTWLISVRDNGIGIDPQYFERIFLIFQRLHTRREYPGTGIGLALCKRIVEHHGGRIWVESDSGKGTTFLFTLGGQSGNSAL